ncbi:MAG: hypothetical protein AAGF96_05950 [Bacteroidota bacterium]
MNGYYKVVDKLREIAQAEQEVNTVTKCLPSEIDQYKATMFPLVHLSPSNSQFNKKEIQLTFEINALTIRDIDKRVTNDKFIANSNEDDNLNAMLYVLIRIYLRIDYWTVEDDFRVVGTPTIEPVRYEFQNILDGWAMTITIGIPIDEVEAC